MNCCDSYGQCTQGEDCPARPAAVAPLKPPVRKYSCAQLGVCQACNPPCIGCFDEHDLEDFKEVQGAASEGLSRMVYLGSCALTAIASVAVLAGTYGYLITRFGA